MRQRRRQRQRQRRQMKDKPKPQSHSQRTARQKANGMRHSSSSSSKVNKFPIVKERVTWQHFVSRRAKEPCESWRFKLDLSGFAALALVRFSLFCAHQQQHGVKRRPCMRNMIINIHAATAATAASVVIVFLSLFFFCSTFLLARRVL